MTQGPHSNSNDWLNHQLQQWQKMLGDPQQWQQLFDNLKKEPLPDLTDQHAQLIEMVRSQSERFTQFAESLTKGEQPDTAQLVDNFQAYMQQQCNEMLTKQWNLPEPLASLIRNSPLSSDTLRQQPFRELLEQLANSPDIGGTPFTGAQIRESSRAILDYQEALNDYLEQYDKIFNRTGEDLKQLLQESKTEIDSVRELQNLWVECYEKAYRETVFTDSYQASHGRISNSLIRARKLAFAARDKKLKEMGFVTREELDSTIRQQHQMRKQLRKQQNQIDQLISQIETLQQKKPARSRK